jgi:arginine decarboxylase
MADSKSKSAYLSSHFNTSRLRTDTWDRLKYKTNTLSKITKPADLKGKKYETTLKGVQEYLDILEPIECYFAFPGKDAFKEIKRLFDRHEFRLLAHRVSHLVQQLFSEEYRRFPSFGLTDPEAVQRQRIHTKASHKHYFEVLYVANLSPDEELEVRTRLAHTQDRNSRFVYDLVVVPSFEDALIAVTLNNNIQSIIIHYGFTFRSKTPLSVLSDYMDAVEAPEEVNDNFSMEHGSRLGKIIHKIRPELDLYLITDEYVEDFATYDVHRSFRRVFYGKENYLELNLSILRGIEERFQTPFFNALKQYSRRPTGVFHALPISRGNSVFTSHWIQDMAEFYGTNIFLAETSATTGGLDSLLQPKGPIKQAQQLASRAFGAQHTFFVTNGTSTANKIVLQGLIQPGDIVLVDRDCHKSHHYGMVLSGALPVYLDSYPLVDYSMYGAVPIREIKHKLLELKKSGHLDQVKMLLLTNCTFDGIVYNVERVMEEVLALKPDMIFLWDEAWFGFARFNPIYRQRTAMQAAENLLEKFHSMEYRAKYVEYRRKMELLDPNDDKTYLDHRLMPDPDQAVVRVYATQSTHKTLSSLRQGAMIHIFDQEYKRKVENMFHESYMIHTSTSPNYQILASLDISRRQVEFEGFELVQRSIEAAMTLREKIKSHPLLKKYFSALGPIDLIPSEFRTSRLQHYHDLRSDWEAMTDAWENDEFVLDPTRITLFTGLTGTDGDTFKNAYLMDKHGIQVNKTSRNSVLFMTNVGTSRSAVAFLIGVLIKIAQEFQNIEEFSTQIEREILHKQIESLTVNLPPLPDFSAFHESFLPYPNAPAGDIRSAFFLSSDEENCKYMKLDGSILHELEKGREVVSASFVIPYPPGFPILVPGQLITFEILNFLKALDVKEIHGFRPELGLRVFKPELLKNRTSENGHELRKDLKIALN